ncbi:MAG: DNA-3-methyladenine glycosylase I [Chthonomonadaceae bacterium]|jgi:DNA-3-methyladenine glycosylase I|nr:DNA-3-methyladenine glycosylase I [Chthonomonadaceae bacterium]
MSKCTWCLGTPEYEKYHDEEWGVPSFDDRHLFEMLILEGAQAGLSWSTILHRRHGYRAAYRDFDPEVVAAFSDSDVERLLQDPGIIRNRAKVRASVSNAQAFLEVAEEFGSFSSYQWRFVEGKPLQNEFKCLQDVPAETPESVAMSKDLRQRGFKFVGPTIVYAHMQSVGMVNDHVTDCPRHGQVRAMASKL